MTSGSTLLFCFNMFDSGITCIDLWCGRMKQIALLIIWVNKSEITQWNKLFVQRSLSWAQKYLDLLWP